MNLDESTLENIKFNIEYFVVFQESNSDSEYRFKVTNKKPKQTAQFSAMCQRNSASRANTDANICYASLLFNLPNVTEPIENYFYQDLLFIIGHSRHFDYRCTVHIPQKHFARWQCG